MLSVNTNTAAMYAYQNLSKTNDAMNQSMQRLSSGYRINSAADDAAGYAISTGMGSQISGMNQAVRNTQDAISVVQTASGALNEATSILQRMRDLAVQAANDSNDTNSRSDISAEVTQLQSELTRIASSTQFNGINLLNGGSLTFQVGANSTAGTNQISVNLTNLTTVATAVTTGGGESFAIVTPTAVTGNFAFSDGTNSATVAMGAAGSYVTVQQVADKLNGTAGFASNFTAYVDGATNNLVVTSKSGGTVSGTAPGTGAAAGSAVSGGVQFDTAAHALSAIAVLDTQIQNVSTAQASLGAYQNRFTHTINNLNTAITNTTASQSRIRDTDMAQEMTNFSKSQILVQAGTAMLAQANAASQSILKLLQG
jgi:flagellin